MEHSWCKIRKRSLVGVKRSDGGEGEMDLERRCNVVPAEQWTEREGGEMGGGMERVRGEWA